jgi:hypothetical protein
VLAIDDLAARESAERSRLAAHGPGNGRSLLRVLRKSSQALDIDDTFDAVHGGQQLRLIRVFFTFRACLKLAFAVCR